MTAFIWFLLPRYSILPMVLSPGCFMWNRISECNSIRWLIWFLSAWLRALPCFSWLNIAASFRNTICLITHLLLLSSSPSFRHGGWQNSILITRQTDHFIGLPTPANALVIFSFLPIVRHKLEFLYLPINNNLSNFLTHPAFLITATILLSTYWCRNCHCLQWNLSRFKWKETASVISSSSFH